jgi:murein DD-endopeptidase MepM/ murein hydrolase activator NlpD
VASAAGIVTSTRYEYSNGEITVTHGDGWQTKYAHMSRIAVTLDQSVASGRLPGYVDDIGNATREHLHYEQDLDGVRVQPRFDGTRYEFGTAVSSTNCSDTTPPRLTGPHAGFLTDTKIKRSGTVPVRDT